MMAAKLPVSAAKAIKIAFDSKDWRAVIAASQSALASLPDNTDALFALATAQANEGDHACLMTYRKICALEAGHTRAKMGFVDALGRSGLWAEQATVAKELRDSIVDTTPAAEGRRAEVALRLASALSAQGSHGDAIAELRAGLARFDSLLEPPPFDDDCDDAVNTPVGPSTRALEPDAAAKLHALRTTSAEALLAAEEARLVAAAAGAGGTASALVTHARDLLQAQRLVLVLRLRGIHSPNEGDCALLLKHLQASADRVKAAAACLHVTQTLQIGAGNGSGGLVACNSNGDHGFGCYRLAVAKHLDIMLWALRQLGCSAAAPLDSFMLSVAQLPRHVQACVSAVCQLGLSYAWPVLSPSTADALLAMLEAAEANEPATGKVLSTGTVIARVGRALVATAAACPPPIIAGAPTAADAEAASSYAATLSRNASAAASALEGFPGGPAAVARVPWLVTSVVALHTAVALCSASPVERREAAVKAVALLQRCVSELSLSAAITFALSSGPALHARQLGAWLPQTLPFPLYAPSGPPFATSTAPPPLPAPPTALQALVAGSALHSTLYLALGTALSLVDRHEEALSAFDAVAAVDVSGAAGVERLSAADRHTRAYVAGALAAAHSGAAAVCLAAAEARTRRWTAEPLIAYRVRLPEGGSLEGLGADARDRLGVLPTPALLLRARDRVAAAQTHAGAVHELQSQLAPSMSRIGGAVAAAVASAVRAQILQLQARLVLLTSDYHGDSAPALAREALSAASSARQGVADAAGSAASAGLGSPDALLPFLGCGAASPALALRISHSAPAAPGKPPRGPCIGACDLLSGGWARMDERAVAGLFLTLAHAAWVSPSPSVRDDKASGCLASLLQAAGRDPSCGGAFALMGCWFASAPDQTVEDAGTGAVASVNGTALPRRGVERARQCWLKAVALQPGQPLATAGLADLLSHGGTAPDAGKAAELSARAAAMLEEATTPTATAVGATSGASGTAIGSPWAWARLGGLALANGCAAAAAATATAAAPSADNETGSGAVAGAESLAASRSLATACTAYQKAIGLLGDALAVESSARTLAGIKAHSAAVAAAKAAAIAASASDDADALGLGAGQHDTSADVTVPTPPALVDSNSAVLTGLRSAQVRCWHGLSRAYKVSGALNASVKAGEACVEAACTLAGIPRESAHARVPAGTSAALATYRKHLCHVPAPALFQLADAYAARGDYEDAVTALRAALGRAAAVATGGDDVVGWYTLACCHRSLARRCIGDGVIGRGLAHVADGLTAALTALALAAPAPGAATTAVPLPPSLSESPAPSLPAVQASLERVESAWASAVPAGPTAPAPIWKVVSDLFACCYDAAPLVWGQGAAAAALGLPSLPRCPAFTDDEHVPPPSAAGWVGVHLPPSDASLPGSALAILGPRYASLAPYAPLLEVAADRGALCAAVAVDAMVRSAAGVPETPAAMVPLAGAWCDVGRLLYLRALSLGLALGGTGIALLPPSAQAQLGPALQLASHYRTLAANAHRFGLAASPTHARCWNGLGVTSAHPSEAHHALLRSEQCGGGGIALVNLGAWRVARGQMGPAGEALLQAQSKDPNNEGLWLTQALIHEALAASAAATAGEDAGDGGLPLTARAEQALAAFTLASDLALSPAALTPSALRALALHAAKLDAPAPVDGSAPVAWSSLPSESPSQMLTLATLASERDPSNPLPALLLLEAYLAMAAEVTRQALPTTALASIDAAEEDGVDGESGTTLTSYYRRLLRSARVHIASPSQSASGTAPVMTSEHARRLWFTAHYAAESYLHRWAAAGAQGDVSSSLSGAAAHEARAASALAQQFVEALSQTGPA